MYGGQQPVIHLPADIPFHLSPRTQNRKAARERRNKAQDDARMAEIREKARDVSNIPYWAKDEAWDTWSEKKGHGVPRPGGARYTSTPLYGSEYPRMAYSTEPRALVGQNLPREFEGLKKKNIEKGGKKKKSKSAPQDTMNL